MNKSKLFAVDHPLIHIDNPGRFQFQPNKTDQSDSYS